MKASSSIMATISADAGIEGLQYEGEVAVAGMAWLCWLTRAVRQRGPDVAYMCAFPRASCYDRPKHCRHMPPKARESADRGHARYQITRRASHRERRHHAICLCTRKR